MKTDTTDDIEQAFRRAYNIAHPQWLALREIRKVWYRVCDAHDKPIDAVRAFDKLAQKFHGKSLDVNTWQSLAAGAIRRKAEKGVKS